MGGPSELLWAVGALRLGGHAVAEVGVDGAPAVEAQASVVVKHAQVLQGVSWRQACFGQQACRGEAGNETRAAISVTPRLNRRNVPSLLPLPQPSHASATAALPHGNLCPAHVGQGVEWALLADEAGRVANLHRRLCLGHIDLMGGGRRHDSVREGAQRGMGWHAGGQQCGLEASNRVGAPP